MWIRSSLLHQDAIMLLSPNRFWRIQSGFGEIEFAVKGRLGTGWELGFGTTETGGPQRWFRGLRYDRYPLSLSIGIGYCLFVPALGGVLLFLVSKLTRPGRRTRKKPASRKRGQNRKRKR